MINVQDSMDIMTSKTLGYGEAKGMSIRNTNL